MVMTKQDKKDSSDYNKVLRKLLKSESIHTVKGGLVQVGGKRRGFNLVETESGVFIVENPHRTNKNRLGLQPKKIGKSNRNWLQQEIKFRNYLKSLGEDVWTT